MTQSHWVNPNGLPDERQVTSARDLAVLARALLLQFPESASLYNIGAMQIGSELVRTHNGLLGRYPGADGMKTGFTCSAGFNLVASATRGGQKLIAVILGAPTAASRTAKAAALLDRAFQSGTPQGPVAALPSFGVGAAQDMHNTACRNRGKASEEYLAEIEDMTIPLDAAGQQLINVKDIAKLPSTPFEPVRVSAGRIPGYQGPVARVRPAGTPVGAEPELTAYATDKPAPEGADQAPILRAAADAKPLRAARPAKAAHHVAAKAHVATQAKASHAKVATLESKKPHDKPEAKAHGAYGKSASKPGKAVAKPVAKKPGKAKGSEAREKTPVENAAGDQ